MDNKQEKPVADVEEPKETKKESTVDATATVENSKNQDHYGTVSSCDALSIRESPTLDSLVIGILGKGSQVLIDANFKNDTYFKITTESGLSGYCAKEFITE